MVSHLEVFRRERINTTKQKDGLTSFFVLSALKGKIFQCDFLEGHNVCEAKLTLLIANISTLREIKSPKQRFFRILVAKDEMYVALATASARNFEAWPMAFKILCQC